MKLFQDLQPVLANIYRLTCFKKGFESKLTCIYLQELVGDLETVSSCGHLYVK